MRITLLSLLFICIAIPRVNAQNQQLKKVDFGSNFFSVKNLSLNDLLGLKFEKEKLKLRRDWKPAKNEALENDPFRHLVHVQQTPIENELRIFAKRLGNRGLGRSGSNNSMTMRVRCPEHYILARTKDQDLFIDILQDKPPYQRFTLEENSQGRLCITLTNESDIARIHQNDVGLVTFSVVNDDVNVIYKAKNFKELFSENPDARDLFVRLLNHMRIERPLSTVSIEVQQFIKDQLIANIESSPQIDELKKFVDQLDDNKYSVRTAATEAIKENFNEWQADLLVLAEQESLSIETRMRIKNILENVKVEQHQHSSVREFATKNKLMKDDDFLFSIADESDSKLMAAIFKQVRQNNPDSTEQQIQQKYERWKTKK